MRLPLFFAHTVHILILTQMINYLHKFRKILKMREWSEKKVAIECERYCHKKCVFR
jgi:hypothetical protein